MDDPSKEFSTYHGNVLLDVACLADIKRQIEDIQKLSVFGFEPFVCTGIGWVVNPNYGGKFVYMLKKGKVIQTMRMTTPFVADRLNSDILNREKEDRLESSKGWRWIMDIPEERSNYA